jgi:hypothetical protein
LRPHKGVDPHPVTLRVNKNGKTKEGTTLRPVVAELEQRYTEKVGAAEFSEVSIR